MSAAAMEGSKAVETWRFRLKYWAGLSMQPESAGACRENSAMLPLDFGAGQRFTTCSPAGT